MRSITASAFEVSPQHTDGQKEGVMKPTLRIVPFSPGEPEACENAVDSAWDSPGLTASGVHVSSKHKTNRPIAT
jgi:hypothetical protein